MIGILYRKILRPVLFLFDPDKVHKAFVSLGGFLGRFAVGRWLIGRLYDYPGNKLSKKVDGVVHRTPIGLAAGFDYNGELANILPHMAFGSEEVGSVTARPCSGNPKPRLKRMVKSEALVVYKGLKNQGVDRIIERLKKARPRDGFALGISIAKTNDRESVGLEKGIEDYYYSLKRLTEDNVGDFYTINISCPNVHGGEDFSNPERLEKLLTRLRTIQHDKPMYAKMPINQDWEEFNEMLKVIDRTGLHGVVIGNLNKNYDEAPHPEEAPDEYRGGLSGSLCKSRSTELIRQTRENWGDRFTIIGCGGILTAEDAVEKLEAGADLLQLITGMIFHGPHLMKNICKKLEKMEDRLVSERTISRDV